VTDEGHRAHGGRRGHPRVDRDRRHGAHPVMDQKPGGTVQVTGTPTDFTRKVTAV
jgi:hypothetical protein